MNEFLDAALSTFLHDLRYLNVALSVAAIVGLLVIWVRRRDERQPIHLEQWVIMSAVITSAYGTWEALQLGVPAGPRSIPVAGFAVLAVYYVGRELFGPALRRWVASRRQRRTVDSVRDKNQEQS